MSKFTGKDKVVWQVAAMYRYNDRDYLKPYKSLNQKYKNNMKHKPCIFFTDGRIFFTSVTSGDDKPITKQTTKNVITVLITMHVAKH